MQNTGLKGQQIWIQGLIFQQIRIQGLMGQHIGIQALIYQLIGYRIYDTKKVNPPLLGYWVKCFLFKHLKGLDKDRIDCSRRTDHVFKYVYLFNHIYVSY